MTRQIKITPIGGVGEVGALNCMVYETDESAIIVDCGVMFPDSESLGVDLIIPDFTYLKQIEHKLEGLVLTHGHEDHIGAVPFLLQEIPLPVYATPFTMGLIRGKLKEHTRAKALKQVVFKPGDKIQVGSFSIDTAFVNHSIIDACALAIETDLGHLVHLTDWKIDKTPSYGEVIDLKKFSKWGKEGVLALLSDSTNLARTGSTLSEKEVTKRLLKMCADHEGRIVVTLFASNIHRIQALAEISKKLGRKLALVGRSMKENTALARDLSKLSFEGVDVHDIEQTNHFPDSKVMCLVTGTQGEPRSALARMAFGEFKPFKIKDGDMVLFSSKVIPGNEKNIFGMINELYRFGAKVIYESVHDIHTSGHAQQDELKEVLKRLKPTHLIPIHGEYRMLVKQGNLADEWGLVKRKNIHIIENGQPLEFDDKGVVPLAPVTVGRVYVDGSGIGDICDLVIRDRRHLADTGMVVCVIMIDSSSGEILRAPELISRGFISDAEKPEILGRAKQVVEDTLAEIGKRTMTDKVEVQEEVRLALSRFFRREKERKPVVIPVILEI